MFYFKNFKIMLDDFLSTQAQHDSACICRMKSEMAKRQGKESQK